MHPCKNCYSQSTSFYIQGRYTVFRTYLEALWTDLSAPEKRRLMILLIRRLLVPLVFMPRAT